MEQLLDLLGRWVPFLLTLLACGIGLWAVQRILGFRGRRRADSSNLGSQLFLMACSGAALVMLILALPIGDTLRGQLLSLLGVLLTAAIALASATFFGNAMGGLMLRAIENIRMGDFVRVGEHFGRVSDMGLLHVEIQNEDRDLTTLPNLYLVTHPVTVVRSTGTFTSATVSLGYDVNRRVAESLLLEAAERTGLKDAFVRVLDLGDFSVSYRVAGFLEDVKILLTVRSRLRGNMLDVFHEEGVEIVSPNFMNQRQLDSTNRFIPKPERPEASLRSEPVAVEARIFDKAEEAEEKLRRLEEEKESEG